MNISKFCSTFALVTMLFGAAAHADLRMADPKDMPIDLEAYESTQIRNAMTHIIGAPSNVPTNNKRVVKTAANANIECTEQLDEHGKSYAGSRSKPLPSGFGTEEWYEHGKISCRITVLSPPLDPNAPCNCDKDRVPNAQPKAKSH